MATTFPPVTHHITVNAKDGTSSFFPPAAAPSQPLGPSAQMTYLYSTPASFDLSTSGDLTYHQSAPTSPPLRSFPPTGATGAVIMDYAPNLEGAEGFMHRTQTVDYVCVLEGELELTLDGGEKKLLKKGEIVLQRAAMHSWRNASKTEPARMIAIAVGGVGAVEGGMEFPKQG
ncbi:hypothetical protein DL95DRAFT_384445 [Leptodontidium sp. 2 PMI_412]|nr:hypothetical protein BKA61DRAFT_697126 [Leptodontidium sp. MPI-SDFR-AT-0119]KAH9219400.1 hypothetical protein DL95DRAFT_384445 [Leptodontidium sp. 2 PMI_412]